MDLGSDSHLPYPQPHPLLDGSLDEQAVSIRRETKTPNPIHSQLYTKNMGERLNSNSSPSDCDGRSEATRDSADTSPAPSPPDANQAPPIRLQSPKRPPLIPLQLESTDGPPLSLAALPSSCSSATRIGSDGAPHSACQPSPQHAEYEAIFAEPDIASHGVEVALPESSDRYRGLSMETAIENLCAIDLSDYERYSRGYYYTLDHHEDWKTAIEPGPLATSFNGPPPPNGWKVYVHPEGTRYFYCDDLRAPVPVITEAWLYDDGVREAVQRLIGSIFAFMRGNGIDFRGGKMDSRFKQPHDNGWPFCQITGHTVLVLEERLTGKFGYYFVDHEQCRLFWLDRYDFSWSTGEVRIQHTETSVGLEMMSQYWKHNEHFPHLYELTLEDLKEISNQSNFALGDVLTSETSAVNGYSLSQLRYVGKIIARHAHMGPKERVDSLGERRTICRVIGEFYHEMFLNLHGERGVRLDSKQSIYYSTHRRKKWVKRSEIVPHMNESRPWYHRALSSVFSPKREAGDGEELVQVEVGPLPDNKARRMHRSSCMLKLAAVVMFGGPRVHANRLREITMDQIVNSHLLDKYTVKMVAEWRDVTLYGTVLLSANVSFLAIQTVDIPSQSPGPKTAAQRASYFSILASLGTIVSGLVLLILVRHREVMGNKLIRVRCQSRWGLESLALMYGAPFSLVIWAFLGFFVSFAMIWLRCGDEVVIGMVATCLFGFTIFLVGAVSASYFENEPCRLLATKAREAVWKGTVDAAEKIVTAGDHVGRGTLELASGAKRRLSTLGSQGGLRRHRGSRSQNPHPTRNISDPGAISIQRLGPGAAEEEAFELRGGHGWVGRDASQWV